jgi:tetratricopeptide (TPR) repeat protein
VFAEWFARRWFGKTDGSNRCWTFDACSAYSRPASKRPFGVRRERFRLRDRVFVSCFWQQGVAAQAFLYAEREGTVEPSSRKVSEAMKLGAMMMTSCLAVSTLMSLGCSRNRQEAVILANAGDKDLQLNPDGAATKYEQATKLDPTNHRIFYKLATAYKKKEDWDKVASTLSRATQLAPKFANYWFDRGYALEMQAKKKTITYEEAKEPYQKCIENDPNYADCYHQLANVFLWTDDEQNALANYTKAIEHQPAEIRYYPPLADLYLNLGYVNEAEQVLKEAKSFAKPGDKTLFWVHVLQSEVYNERKSVPERVTELEAAKAVAGTEGAESIQILFMLGSTYAVLEPPRTQEAVQMLKGFTTRACKGSKAASYKTECEQSQALITKLGGS